ncbi:MAG: IS30 family transposase [Acidimicrobiales bacterium]
MRRPRRRSRTARNLNKRPASPNIADRPVVVNERVEPGHWEADQIIGKKNRSSMIILTERVTRYSIPVTMPCGYTAPDVLAGLVVACEQIPAHLLRSGRSIRDLSGPNGNASSPATGHDCWFCEPHSPWQRGQIENLNRQYRFWFPRGTDLAAVAQQTPTTPPASSTGNAAAASTTTAPTISTLPLPCTDHWNWPPRIRTDVPCDQCGPYHRCQWLVASPRCLACCCSPARPKRRHSPSGSCPPAST